MALAYIFVGLRLAVRVNMRQRHLWLSDILLLLGLAFCQGLLICDTVTYGIGSMVHTGVSSTVLGKVGTLSPPQFDRAAET